MKMDYFRKDGYKMYTKLLRKINKLKRVFAGHCGGGGHCS